MKMKRIMSSLLIFFVLLIVQGCTNDNDKELYNQRENLTKDEIRIKIDDVTKIAKFYPVMVDGTKMEVIAVRANDGTVRLAFNACQVCSDSGKGYYVQEGEYLICQNCGTKFSIDQIGVARGGCNPAPISDDEKTEVDGYYVISKNVLESSKDLFMY